MQKVIVTVSGGIADVTEKPNDLEVEIRDYDVEGMEEDVLKTDEDGDKYREMIF